MLTERVVKLLSTTIICSAALAFATPAAAQDTQPAPQPPEDSGETAQAGEGGQTLVVTGTRIIRDGYTAPTPVTVATTEDLARIAPTNIPDALNRLPQFQNSNSPSRSALNFANLPIHGNILNLRGIGPLRTLILFDGIRVPPTTYLGTVDTNVIPNLLVQRVDVVTGGASAAYGSDAVSGVVNFVLDRNFTGFSGLAQAGVSQRGDNENYRLAAAGGFEFAGGAGHLLLSAEYYNNGGMLRSERAIGLPGWTFVGSNANCVNPNPAANPTACSPGGTLNPYVAAPNVRITLASFLAKISSAPPGNPFANFVFERDGSFRPFVNGTRTGSAFQLGGDGYTISSFNSSIAPLTTYQLFGRASYELTDSIEAYVQGVWSRADIEFSSLSNAFIPPTGAPIFQGNPFLPAAINATLAPGQSILIGQQYAAGPHPVTEERTDFWMATGGLEGSLDLGGDWNWDISYTHGDSDLAVDQSGLYNWRNTYAALDVVLVNGVPTCRVLTDPVLAPQYAGCQPLNVLTSDPARATPAGYAYATGTSSYRARIKQDSVVASVSGNLFELPAGPLSVAAGVEYRAQSLNLASNADPALLDTPAERSAHFAGLRGVAPSALFFWLTNVGVADGSLNVKEAFAEIAVPIFRDQPFFRSLELNAAGRITDYSTSGTVETWKLGATWRPIEDLLLRVTRSRDIRAPNLFELFAGDQSGIGFLVDAPVTQGGSGLSSNVSSVIGGNPDLQPEIADTFTAGGVISPRFLPGFSFAVDYYDIKIDDAIGSLTTQQIVTNCANSGGTAPECALITRPGPGQFPTLIRNAPANISFLETSGIDFDASYRTRIGEGALNLRLYASHLLKFRSQQFSGAPVLEFEGVNVVTSNPSGFPRWRGTLTADYSIGGFGITLTEQYIHSMRLGIPGAPQNFVDPHVGAEWYTDLSIRQRVPGYGGHVEFFGTVNNLFDNDPPLIPGTVPAVNLPTNLAIYDTVGRAFTFGMRFRF